MDTPVEVGSKSLLLFDGVCNLCNRTVNFVMDKDKDQRFVFASLQSNLGQQVAKQYHLPKNDFKSIILIKQHYIFLKSDAVLEIAKELVGKWCLLYGLKIIPKMLRDWIYDIIAINRYKWFGKKNHCNASSGDNNAIFANDHAV